MTDIERVKKRKCRCLPTRYVVALMSAMGMVLVVGTRASFAFIMTHVTLTNETQPEANLIFSDCTVFNTSSDLRVPIEGDVSLMLHTVFYAGYTFSLAAGGILVTAVSTRIVAGSAILMYSVATLLLPYIIPFSTPFTFIIRAVQGVLEGVKQVTFFTIVAAWMTSADRSLLLAIVQSGMFSAPALASVLTATSLCYISWDAVFFMYGGAGIVWSLLWVAFIYDNPDLHPRLSLEEKLHHREHGDPIRKSCKEVMKNTPWRHILTSPGVWAVFIAVFNKHVVVSMQIVELSQYFQDSFNFKVEDLGVLSVIPYIMLGVSIIAGGFICDGLLKLGLSKIRTSKLVYTAAYGMEASCLISLYFVKDWKTAFIIICSGVSLGGCGCAAHGPLPSYMSPQYTNAIYGLALSGAFGGLIITLVASQTAGRNKTLHSWQGMYLLAGLLQLTCMVLFNIMADARLQPWAEGNPDKSERPLTDSTRLQPSDNGSGDSDVVTAMGGEPENHVKAVAEDSDKTNSMAADKKEINGMKRTLTKTRTGKTYGSLKESDQ